MIPFEMYLTFDVGPWCVEAEKCLDLPSVPAVGTKIHMTSIDVTITGVEYYLADKQYVLRASMEKGDWGRNLPPCDDPRYLEAVLNTLRDRNYFGDVQVQANTRYGAVGDSKDQGQAE